jgi:hypothetical protein
MEHEKREYAAIGLTKSLKRRLRLLAAQNETSVAGITQRLLEIGIAEYQTRGGLGDGSTQGMELAKAVAEATAKGEARP